MRSSLGLLCFITLRILGLFSCSKFSFYLANGGKAQQHSGKFRPRRFSRFSCSLAFFRLFLRGTAPTAAKMCSPLPDPCRLWGPRRHRVGATAPIDILLAVFSIQTCLLHIELLVACRRNVNCFLSAAEALFIKQRALHSLILIQIQIQCEFRC